jgi:hypothetical protein
VIMAVLIVPAAAALFFILFALSVLPGQSHFQALTMTLIALGHERYPDGTSSRSE